MSDRISEFLKTTHCAGWARHPLAGDASSRRYERIIARSDETAILMDAENSAPEELTRFAAIADALRHAGLAAPQIYEVNAQSGLMLIEDLGPNDIAKTLRQDATQGAACYAAATDVLLHMRNVAPLVLPELNAKNAADWLAPLGAWYGPVALDISSIQDAMRDAWDALGLVPDTLALRDYHAENLIWRPENNGLQIIGLLDFQDAVYAPAGYDLASLTRDARRDVDPNMADTLTLKMAHALDINPSDFNAQTACLAVQRNLRILGIFASLAKRDGKSGYAAFTPRVWTYLQRDLAHPALTKLQVTVHDIIPEPTPSFLAQWST